MSQEQGKPHSNVAEWGETEAKEIESLRQQLAAISRKQHEALAMPSDNTALLEYGKQAEERGYARRSEEFNFVEQAKREALLEAAAKFGAQLGGYDIAEIISRMAKEMK